MIVKNSNCHRIINSIFLDGMIYCNNCGHPNSDSAKFCGSCGNQLRVGNNEQYTSNFHHINNMDNSNVSSQGGHKTNKTLFEQINEYVGNDKPADLNWKVLFSDVFKSHTTEDAEEIFICGTRATTPDASNISKEWPHPWLYSRVFLMFFIAFILLWICVDHFDNNNALPGMIVVGSFTVPLATMILFLEVNAWRNISMYHVIKTFLVGGCASLVATLFLFSIYDVGEMDYIGAFSVGVIEELGKAVIVYAFLKHLKIRAILPGMLVGASIGAGFAAFESAGYAMQPLMAFWQNSGFYAAYGQALDGNGLIEVVNQSIFLRGFLAPGGHVAWAAISGAALVIVGKTKGEYDTSFFTDAKFLRLFLIPVVLHGLWDCPFVNVTCNQIVPFSGWIALIISVWVVLLILINMGLSEVSRSQ